MIDARWHDVMEAVRSCERRFDAAGILFDEGGFSPAAAGSYRNTMALLHATQAGHTSLEAALVRIMNLIGEQPPAGGDWHARLIARAAANLPGRRPAILTPAIVAAAHTTRSFRHLAMHSYDFDFDTARAVTAVRAGDAIARALPTLIETFGHTIDR